MSGYFCAGEMAERSNAAVLKTVDPKGPGVRIPLSPLSTSAQRCTKVQGTEKQTSTFFKCCILPLKSAYSGWNFRGQNKMNPKIFVLICSLTLHFAHSELMPAIQFYKLQNSSLYAGVIKHHFSFLCRKSRVDDHSLSKIILRSV